MFCTIGFTLNKFRDNRLCTKALLRIVFFLVSSEISAVFVVRKLPFGVTTCRGGNRVVGLLNFGPTKDGLAPVSIMDELYLS